MDISSFEDDLAAVQQAPRRLRRSPEAVRRFGSKAALYAAALRQGDPLADALAADIAGDSTRRIALAFEAALTEGLASVVEPPDSLRAFFDHVEATPAWLDREKLDAGGVSYLRLGPALQICMTAALAAGYNSAASVKPLARTRRFIDSAEPRARETGIWFFKTLRPGGLAPRAPGYQATVRVRLVHAMVRRALLRTGDWNEADWGAPLNMGDTSRGIATEFTTVPIDAARKMGYTITESEADAMHHLFRYVGYLLGVPESLLPQNQWQARELTALIDLTNDGPDEDCRRLIHSLLNIGPSDLRAKGRPIAAAIVRDLLHGYVRVFAGDADADRQGVRNTPFKHVLSLSRPFARLRDKQRQGASERAAFAIAFADLILRDLAGVEVVDASLAAAAVSNTGEMAIAA
jgi:hypothetical protein